MPKIINISLTEIPIWTILPEDLSNANKLVVNAVNNNAETQEIIDVESTPDPDWVGFWFSFLQPENIDFYNRIVFVSSQYNSVDCMFSLVKESINTTRIPSALISARDFLREALQEVNADFTNEEIILWNNICDNCNLSEVKF